MSDRFALGVWRQEPGQKGFNVEATLSIRPEEFERYVNAIATYQSLTERNTYQILTRNHLRLRSMLELYTNIERVGGNFRMIDQRTVAVLFMGETTNWLASTRLYLVSERDFILNQFGEASEEVRAFDKATSQAFDTYAGYRFLYNLRDYAQHCGPPVSGVTISRDPATRRKIELYLSRSELLVARFNWNRHAKQLLENWPEQISVLPLIEESMAGFRLIEDEVLRILIARCGAAIATMREGIERVASAEGHRAVFQLPESKVGGSFTWKTFPELSALDAIDEALASGDPLESLRKDPAVEPELPPPQRYANSRAAAVIAARLEDENGEKFAEAVNRVIREDQNITPLISGLGNVSLILIKMLGQALGTPPQDLLGSFSDPSHDYP